MARRKMTDGQKDHLARLAVAIEESRVVSASWEPGRERAVLDVGGRRVTVDRNASTLARKLGLGQLGDLDSFMRDVLRGAADRAREAIALTPEAQLESRRRRLAQLVADVGSLASEIGGDTDALIDDAKREARVLSARKVIEG